MNTISELLMKSTKQLREQNCQSSRLDAEVLLAHALGVDRTYFLLNDNKEVGKVIESKYHEFLNRRIKGEPIAYIVGHQEFMGIDFIVNKNVLIPRPDTEILVEHVIEQLKDIQNEITVLDIGTGSGAIALSIGKFISNSIFTLVDISKEALEVAKQNTQRLDMTNRVTLCLSDCFIDVKKQKFDVIVSNPPYIPTQHIDHLQKEVSCFEPRGALDGGNDGLLFYKRIALEAKEYLKPGGLIAFEIGYDQAKDVINLLIDNGYHSVEKKKDYGSNDRVVVGRFR